MAVFKPKFQTLPKAQRTLWPSLAPIARQGFVLYGGTALALRLGHRESVDFDFFSDRELDKKRVYDALSFSEQAQTIQDERNALTVLVPVGENFVKISFFGGIGFGRVGESESTDDGVLEAASLIDLYGTKMKVLFDRIEAKDYRDIAALIRHGMPLESGLGAARALFGRAFQPAEALKALTYFEGGDLGTLSHEDRFLLISHVTQVKDIEPLAILSRLLSAHSLR